MMAFLKTILILPRRLTDLLHSLEVDVHYLFHIDDLRILMIFLCGTVHRTSETQYRPLLLGYPS